MNIDLRLGDCIDILKTLEDNSVDSIVTDPPYGLSFMGKKWDYDVPSVEIWTECLRVLKPGGHLLSFGGSRTYHRMAVAIEDAGFEVRDQIMWIYASGFPKSHNISKSLIKLADEKERTEQETEHNLRCVPNSNLQETKSINKEQGETLLYGLSEQSLSSSKHSSNTIWGQEPILEGGNNIQETEGKLQGSKIHKMSEGILGDGEERWIHNGTQISYGETSKQIINENGSSPSHRPQPIKQSNRKSNVVSQQLTSQEIREAARKYNNYGSALKPAHEPICMARKPLSEKSIAENVLKHGTGGINIDGCRVGTELISHGTSKADIRGGSLDGSISGSRPRLQVEEHITEGRFPANIMFDEEAGKILDEQSDKASRFFYCPKVSKKERNAGLEDMENRPSQLNSGGIGRKTSVEKRLETNGENAPTTKNHHPTVKPIALMEYLIKLVTPKGGTVLEPFMGSGSTGIAAKNLGMSFIGIEKEEEYFEIAKQRINGN